MCVTETCSKPRINVGDCPPAAKPLDGDVCMSGMECLNDMDGCTDNMKCCPTACGGTICSKPDLGALIQIL